jgi:hypothetical protein
VAGHAIAQVVSCQVLITEAGFSPRLVHVGCFGGEMGTGTGLFSKGILFPLCVVIL